MLVAYPCFIALLSPPPANTPANYDGRRAVKIVQELASRSLGMLPSAGAGSGDTKIVKDAILDLLSPFGDPALNVPESTLLEIDSKCRELEACNQKKGRAAIAAIEGIWKVRFSDAPPPSNGALGPLRGRAFQVVDVASQSYSNELTLFGGALNIKLDATFEPKDDASAPATALRVAFRSITFSLLGVRLPSVDFPAGTERTWLLTFADDDTRLVRAGVDGGKSTARDIGLIEKGAGEAADSYLFVLTRASEAEYSGDADGAGGRAGSNPLSASLRRRELKAKLLDECRDANLGAGADASSVASIGGLIEQLAELNPTNNPASSPLLCSTWDILWTTESELLALTANGFFGLPCTAAYQTIQREGRTDGEPGVAYTLSNSIDFEKADGADGFLRVGSTCEPAATGGRVDFRFESCAAKWRQLELPLPPVGAGWFEVLYMDEELRLCKDSRGDLQVCTRR